ncbi:hypothetical protein APHAL10511_006915 [Amanita phalloides]|nr:hypothetical protein APHAL10511_006915 [Amanita phalloides]
MRSFAVPYLSLALFALPVLSTKYHVCSSIALPSNCIVSTGNEAPGSAVTTAYVNHGYPPNMVVDVHASITPKTDTYGPVSGKSGLYVGISENGKYLVWVKKPYQWEFSHGSAPQSHVVHIPKRAEFWVDAADNSKPVELVGPGFGDALNWYFHQ